jgi:hypothetical protein
MTNQSRTNSPANRMALPGVHQLGPQPPTEHRPVVAHRGDQQRRRHRRQDQGGQVDALLGAAEVGKAGGEGQAQQEGEQDLDAGLGDPELLDQLGELAVAGLQLGLAADGLVPLRLVPRCVVIMAVLGPLGVGRHRPISHGGSFLCHPDSGAAEGRPAPRPKSHPRRVMLGR